MWTNFYILGIKVFVDSIRKSQFTYIWTKWNIIENHTTTNALFRNLFVTIIFRSVMGGILVHVRNGNNAKRLEDLKFNGISCLWVEEKPEKDRSFLVDNLYRPPDSKIEYNDRSESFIDNVSKDGKTLILLGDFKKNLSVQHTDREWFTFTLSLG